MIEVQGKYGVAKVFTYNVEKEALESLTTLCDQPWTAGAKIRVMPDVHAGKGCCIGTTMMITDKIVPNLVGVDIGCGMTTFCLKEKEIDLVKLDEVIRAFVPSGFNIHNTPTPYGAVYFGSLFEDLYCNKYLNGERALLSIGTLGGGNHFIEIGKGRGGDLFLVVHSGSRNMGHQIATHYQQMATAYINSCGLGDIKVAIDSLKATGKEASIQQAIKEIKARNASIPKGLEYLEGEGFHLYLHDMRLAQEYAELNRCAIIETILTKMGLDFKFRFSTVHNYISFKGNDGQERLLRKGAVSAQKNELLLIPLNMRDGSLICKGKGNPDWNYSAPHGAGRIMSRTKAKETLSLSQFEADMKDVYSTSICGSTLDESPRAYKPAVEIIKLIEDTAVVQDHLIPIYNFKAK